jgi:ribosomal protein S2
MRQMLEAGVHFGHQTRRWNPKMKQFIFGERNGIHIINLDQTIERVEVAYAFVRDLVANGGTILFVGTKKQAQDPIRSYAEKCGMHYVNERWLGGMLTNFETISKRVGKMQEYERMKASGEFDAMPKKEALLLTRELEKLQKNLSGMAHLSRRPDAIFVLDTMKEHIAVTEANKLKVKAAVAPKRSSTTVDEEMFERFLEYIAHGARARLYNTPNQPYYDPKTAMQYTKLFNDDMAEVRTRVYKGLTRAAARIEFQRFA